ncbi:hypothetical protein DY000_02013152 [Brassica cretica]|uniref:Uncharacterized protein n=1 Tax=Brassica cretica TaxID=69181 RepID=A0ABQ7CN03_BRACR|nr:hypothetical protein DY000_02013152 [Brassica cretica]
MGTRRQLEPIPSRLCDELVSLERRDGQQRKPALRPDKSESEPERWPRPSQHWNFSCRRGKKTC